MSDLIERQMAVNAVDAIGHIATMPDGDKCIRRSAVKYTLSMLPSAQPEERTEKHAETHACDLVSKQAVLDLAKDLKFDNVEGLKHYRYRCIDPDDVRELKSVQLTEAIPVAWIEEEIAILKAKGKANGNELAPMLMSAILSSELDNWKERLKNDNS